MVKSVHAEVLFGVVCSNSVCSFFVVVSSTSSRYSVSPSLLPRRRGLLTCFSFANKPAAYLNRIEMKILSTNRFFIVTWLTQLYFIFDSYASLYSEELDPIYATRKFAPTNRYKELVREHLLRFVKNGTKFVEITSGTGQLISYLAEHFPAITFVPCDHDPYNIPSIEFYKKLNMAGNLKVPFLFDVRISSNKWFKRTMQNETVDYFFNSYLIHLAPPECYQALIRGVNQYLKHRGLFFLLGPFRYFNNTLSESNRVLHQQLREANPLWGLRDAETEIREELEKLGIFLTVTFNFPSDLQLHVYKKGTRVLW